MPGIHRRFGLPLLGALCAWALCAAAPAHAASAAPQERQCMARGWQRIVTTVADLPRILLWKAPAGPWTSGAILVLHGGGGRHFQWCVANAEIVAPQVRFSELALAQGFAVFLLDSSDRVTDNQGRACGKVWDDEVRLRANLDLPFIEELLRARIPALRPAGSRDAVFMTGLSSGGYMTVRASTHFDDRVARSRRSPQAIPTAGIAAASRA